MFQILFYAGAAEAAGLRQQEIQPISLDQDLRQLVQQAAINPIDSLLEVATFLVNGQLTAGDHKVERLPAAAKIEVLPPFAGG